MTGGCFYPKLAQCQLADREIGRTRSPYAFCIVDPSETEVPQDSSRKGGEGVMVQNNPVVGTVHVEEKSGNV